MRLWQKYISCKCFYFPSPFPIQSSTLTTVDEPLATLCWTSFPATSRCFTAESRPQRAPNKGTRSRCSARPAAGNGAGTPSERRRKGRGARRSWGPSASWPSQWLRNAETSKVVTAFIKKEMCHSQCCCFQKAASSSGWWAQQLEPAEEEHPPLPEEAEGRRPRVAELHEALAWRHPSDWGWGGCECGARQWVFLARQRLMSPLWWLWQGCSAPGSSPTSPSCASWLCSTLSSSCSCSALSCCPSS